MTLKCGLGVACNLCGECVDVCPTGAITINKELNYDGEKCSFCEVCMDVCPECAIRIYEEDK